VVSPGQLFDRARRWRSWLAVTLTLALLPPLAAAPAARAANGPRDTSVTDFAACPIPAGLVAANEAGGELRRPASVEDYFDGAVSSTLWSWGTWTGATYSPVTGSGALVVQSAASSAWLRSVQGFSQRTLSARATLGAGPWQHVGWGETAQTDRYLYKPGDKAIVTVYARTFDGGVEQHNDYQNTLQVLIRRARSRAAVTPDRDPSSPAS